MNPFKTVSFYTLGCKLNFSESSSLGNDFKDAGYSLIPFGNGADVHIINTCSVTDNANKKCRNIVRKVKNSNPDSYIAVIGCYAQLKPKELLDIKEVNLVLGTGEKFNILKHIESHFHSSKHLIHSPIKESKEFFPSISAGDRTRVFLKVQDGCDYFCSFCTIPLARGTSRSGSIESTINMAKKAITNGAKELILTGVNIGDFGKDTEENFLQLIQKLDTLEGIERIRISSIEPNLLSNDIIEFVAHSRHFMPHFHIPLQSGSDLLLKSMRRRYTTQDFKNRIETIKRLIPFCGIGLDVIVGYPGETDALFLETLHFIKEINPSYLHVFTYSERENTTAIRMENSVEKTERYQRSKQLQLLSEKLKRNFYSSQLGTTRPVLIEALNQNTAQGYTDNYIRVEVDGEIIPSNSVVMLPLDKINASGEVVSESFVYNT